MKHESIESFLKRGGSIMQVPRGVSGYDSKKISKHITYSRKANPNMHDPKAPRRRDNESLFK